jgi:hypothetical protein
MIEGAESEKDVAPAGGVSSDSTPSMGTGAARDGRERLPIDTTSVSVSSWQAQAPLTSWNNSPVPSEFFIGRSLLSGTGGSCPLRPGEGRYHGYIHKDLLVAEYPFL